MHMSDAKWIQQVTFIYLQECTYVPIVIKENNR